MDVSKEGLHERGYLPHLAGCECCERSADNVSLLSERIAELEGQLAEARLALHPLDTIETHNGEAATINHDPYLELEGALIDLERTKADASCINTVRRVQGQVLAAMRALQT